MYWANNHGHKSSSLLFVLIGLNTL